MPSQYDYNGSQASSGANDRDQPANLSGRRPPVPRRPAPPLGNEPSAMPWRNTPNSLPNNRASVANGNGGRRPGNKPRKGMTLGKNRLIAAGITTVVLGSIAFAAGKVFNIARVATGAKSGDIGGTIRNLWELTNPLSQFPAGTQRLNILLIGKDYNHTNKDIVYTKGSRSDTLILFSLDLQNRKVTALSIPRDTYIPERHGKINAAYAQGGAPMAMKAVGDLLGVQPDYAIALKPDGVKAIVDELGGVEITSLDTMKYDDNWGGLHINLPAGTYSINGDQAIGYTRFRKPNPGLPHSKEEGDSRRMARQQNLVRAMAAKAKTPEVFLHADKLVDLALNQVETTPTLSRTQLLAIASLFKDIKPEEITSGTLLGEGGRVGKMYVFKPDEEKTKHLVDWLIRGDEEAANGLTQVAVQNGTKTVGAARKMSDMLKEQGYDAHTDGNAPAPAGTETPTEYPTSRLTYYKASMAPRAQKIAQLMGVREVVKAPLPPALEAASTEDSGDVRPPDITIVLGKDLVGQIVNTKQSAKL